MLQILNDRILNNSIDKRINCGNSSGKILMLQMLSDACLHMLWEVGKTPVREGAVSIMHRCWISALMPICPTYRILTIVYRCLPDYPIICTHTANDHPPPPPPGPTLPYQLIFSCTRTHVTAWKELSYSWIPFINFNFNSFPLMEIPCLLFSYRWFINTEANQ